MVWGSDKIRNPPIGARLRQPKEHSDADARPLRPGANSGRSFCKFCDIQRKGQRWHAPANTATP